MTTPSVLKGTRDFLPSQISKREFLFSTVKEVYRKFGFLPIETPAMEKSETLMGKYGEEGDKLIFKILNNGDFMSGVDAELPSGKLATQISKRALRYDLTVPFARFVSQHRNDLQFPFKRYQIQPVWRADRPQKGRYQEFFQCDADVIGTDALMYEVEFIQIFDEVLDKLGLQQFTIHVNNRKVLAGLAEVSDCEEYFGQMAMALDKLDKIGVEKVKEEWLSRGISSESVEKLSAIFDMDLSNPFPALRELLAHSATGLKGVEELEYIFKTVDALGLNKADLAFNPTLARGLDYYTGAIFEVTTTDYAIGSICGGGRYDDLTGVFGLPDMSGVGISFGADRIYDVLEATNKWPTDLYEGPAVIFINFGPKEAMHSLKVVSQLRKEGIAAEVYATDAKMKKQMKYANDRNIPFVALIGTEEMDSGKITLRDMKAGSQEVLDQSGLLLKLKAD